jgi:type III restriction enzyme
LQGADFKALWERIKHKTTYRVQFDNEALLVTCIKAFADAPPIAKTRLQWRKADLAIGRSGVETKETATSAPVTLDEGDIELPDILTDLQDKTQLTRRSIHRILVDSKRLDDFKRNPQQFIELAAEIINRAKRWPSWTASSTSALATSTITPRNSSSRKNIRLPQEHAGRQRSPSTSRSSTIPTC